MNDATDAKLVEILMIKDFMNMADGCSELRLNQTVKQKKSLAWGLCRIEK